MPGCQLQSRSPVGHSIRVGTRGEPLADEIEPTAGGQVGQTGIPFKGRPPTLGRGAGACWHTGSGCCAGRTRAATFAAVAIGRCRLGGETADGQRSQHRRRQHECPPPQGRRGRRQASSCTGGVPDGGLAGPRRTRPANALTKDQGAERPLRHQRAGAVSGTSRRPGSFM
ncbi:MAG: hypothetical protein AW07_04662 [Candidatus Accumulibacter sp. SK-11]|nr:MAG: hypothetical protein AW07_04662 [Candidatus Accumulibacter sp. SK-11]